ncbi:MAG: non-hydrolyzing UDP-N-acetylglucosamine 2-epimerase [Solirubrobacteraceae bacterium]
MSGRRDDAICRWGVAETVTPTVIYVVGARPNFVKMAPVLSEMRARAPELRHVLVHTGQHYDAEMSDIFFEELGLQPPDHLLGVGSGAHGAQTARALERLEEVFTELRPRAVLVPGDVNSTLAAALAAAKLGIPIAHLEAGLRSFDRAMPEELNRVLVDQLSSWCLIHSAEAAANLEREGIEPERVHFVGNTMIDTLVRLRPRIEESHVLDDLALERRRYLLVTLHRPALVDGPLLEPVMSALAEVARELPVLFPMHPRTRARLPAELASAPGLEIVDPVGYIDFLAMQAFAAGVLTDSGGVQEETTFLGVPCFTLRENTERPITITHGSNSLLGLSPAAITRIPGWLASQGASPPAPHGWDGRAATRVADVLLADLGDSAPAPSYATEPFALDAPL